MTLIDVLVATALLTLGGAGLLSIQLTVMRANLTARQISEATLIGRARMEALGYDRVPPASGNDTVVRGGVTYTRTWTVTAGTPTRLRVRVAWSAGDGQERQVVLDALR